MKSGEHCKQEEEEERGVLEAKLSMCIWSKELLTVSKAAEVGEMCIWIEITGD